MLAFAAGIYASRTTGLGLVESAGAALVLLLGAAIARKLARRAAWCALLASIAMTGAFTGALRKTGPAPVIDYESGETLLFTGCIVEPPVFFEGRERFLVELEPGARAAVNVYLAPDQPPPQLAYGERVEFEARIRKPRNFENPGGFDYASYLARRNVHWNLSVSSKSPLKRLAGTCGSPIMAVLTSWRGAGLERLDTLFAADRFALGMSRALLLGDDSRLEKVWTEDFRRTGTYHALVISGLHLTTLAGCLLFLLRICSLGPGLSLGLTAAAAWTYALMVGAETPVTRAAAGMTLFLIARYFFRRPRLLNVLGAVGIVFLIVDPDQLFDASFHLSFLSVAMIGAFASPLLDRISTPYSRSLRSLENERGDAKRDAKEAAFRVEMRLLAETLHLIAKLPQRACLAAIAAVGRVLFFFVDLFVVSAVIQAGLVLPMVVYFHRVSLSGLSANLLVVPLTNTAVPVGFLAIATGWAPLAWATAWLLAASQAVAQWHARLESTARVPAPPGWLAWAFLASLLLAALAVASAHRGRIIAGLAVFCASLGLVVAHPFAPRLTPGKVELTAIDVGQGDSLMVAGPQGKLMIVDGGGFPVYGRRSKPVLDIGEDVVSPYLWSRSIRRIDVLVATHAHEDHIGGLAALIDNFRPRELWTGAAPDDDPGWEKLRRHAVERGVRIVTRHAGERFNWGGVGCEVLSPETRQVSQLRARNNDSLVLRLTYGSTSFLLTGDIERAVEQRLLEAGLVQRTDVLKVAHHGSRTSTTQPFLDAARPSIAIISDGYENVYRFPHRDVLERLNAAGAQVWRTDLNGLVRIESDGKRIVAEPYRRNRLLQPPDATVALPSGAGY